MDFVIWQDKYTVENDLLDSQHKKLFELVNQLYDGVKDRRSAKSIQKIIDELVPATIEHFDTEEKMMKNINFPFLGEHRLEHENLKKKMLHMQNVYIFGDVPLTPEVFSFLRNWLIEHIEGQDKKYAGKLI